MYLAISVVAAMCAFLAAVQTRNAKRLGADLRQKRQRKRRPDEFSAELRRLGNAARRPDGYG